VRGRGLSATEKKVAYSWGGPPLTGDIAKSRKTTLLKERVLRKIHKYEGVLKTNGNIEEGEGAVQERRNG